MADATELRTPAEWSALDGVEALTVVDRVALRLMRTQVFGPSLEPRWAEITRSRWTLLSDEGRENFRAVARTLLADIALGDDGDMPAWPEYEVRHPDGDVHGDLDDVDSAVDFADRVWPGSKVFQRTRVSVHSEWTEVTA